MTEQDKELLLIDLCARLPFGVLCEDMEGKTRPLFGITPTQHFIVTLDNATDGTNGLKFCTIDCVKPYLRPMSSMTKEEEKEYAEVVVKSQDCSYENNESATTMVNDWYLSKGFDVRGLIPKGLALEAPKGMYK